LQPYTDETLKRMGREGVKRLVVLTPAFVSDCLETLEEIATAGKESFRQAGGGEFRHVPCLNDHPLWVQFLARRIEAWRTGGA
jgi:ferrochelatase